MHSSMCCEGGVTVTVTWCRQLEEWRVVVSPFTGPELWFDDIDRVKEQHFTHLTEALAAGYRAMRDERQHLFAVQGPGIEAHTDE